MQIAAYICVSTNDQNEQRQMRAIRAKYAGPEQDNEIDWYCDLGESGALTSRRVRRCGHVRTGRLGRLLISLVSSSEGDEELLSSSQPDDVWMS
jgi:hypothetical protein